MQSSPNVPLQHLLRRWHEHRRRGEPLAVEELCRDCPERIPEVQRALEAGDGGVPPEPPTRELPTSSQSETPTQGEAGCVRREGLRPGLEPVPGYQLVKRLGGGGFGEVWQATGPGGVHVAFKFVALDGSAGAIELQALEIIKNIRHPNLLALFGTWQTELLLVIGMELADATLLDRFEGAAARGLRGIPARELLGYSADAAKVLDFLNKPRHFLGGGKPVGIQHGDVKPQNILLVGGGVKVGDFGLVRLLERKVAEHRGGMTVLYAAPEIFQGKVSRWSDQYALAVTYCHLRGGRVPYTGSPAQILAAQLTGAPDLTMLPPEERSIVARALATSPADRWPSCRTFIRALGACQRAPREYDPPPAPSGAKGVPKSRDSMADLLPRAPAGSRATVPKRGAVRGWRKELAGSDEAGARDRTVPAFHGLSRRMRAGPGCLTLLLIASAVAAVIASQITFLSRPVASEGPEGSASLLTYWRTVALLGGAGLLLSLLVWAVIRRWRKHQRGPETSGFQRRSRLAPAVLCQEPADRPAEQDLRPELMEQTQEPPSVPPDVTKPAAGEPAVRHGFAFEGHEDSVWSVAWSPDGRGFLSASMDATLRWWTLDSQPGRVFRGHGDGVTCVAMDRDGVRALSGSLDQTVRLWDVASRSEVRCLRGHAGRVFGVAFSPDGVRAVSGGEDRSLRLWDLESGRELHRLEGHSGWVTGVAFLPGGRQVVSGSEDGSARLWDLETGQVFREFRGHAGGVKCLALSPDARYLVTGGTDQTVRIWDIATGDEVRCLPRHTDWVRGVAWSEDGTRILSASDDETVCLCGAASGTELNRFRGHEWSVLGVAFAPDGRFALSASDDRTIRLWRIAG
jgi:hypothetical protein